jgi:excisionase family DNA binding protein
MLTSQNTLRAAASLASPTKPKPAKKAPQKQEPQQLDRLLSMQKTAEVLGVHIFTVRRLIEAGKLVAVRVANRKIGIRASSIERHMAANQLVDFKA